MSLSQVQVLFCDVFGTFVDWENTVSRECLSFIKAHPAADPAHQAALLALDWRNFTRQWRQGYKIGTYELSQTGNPDKVTVDEMHLRILNQLINDLAPSELSQALDKAWDNDTRQSLNSIWHRLDPWPDTVNAMLALKKYAAIGTLTNGNLALMVEMAKHSQLPWDFLLTADLLGSFKPDPAMYNTAMRLMDIKPASSDTSKAAMVAAHLYDLEAAKACGMTTIFISGRESEDSLPAQGKPIYVDIVVKDLNQLAHLLAAERKQG